MHDPMNAQGAGGALQRATSIAASPAASVFGSAAASSAPPAGARLVSLDAFRGFTIAAMMLVNNPGDWDHVYRQLDHAQWNGWTFTDWIFPFFLFTCGTAMALSIERRLGEGSARMTLLRQFALRAAIIFAIGLTLNFIPAFDLSTLRIPGVLQRIALCILLAAPIVLSSPREHWIRLLAWIVALLAAYSLLQLAVPVPGFDGKVAAGVLEPGRDAGAFVDRFLLGGHLWATARTWDPEGLVSTLPAVATLLFGVLAGYWLLASEASAGKAIAMLVAGLASLAAGSVLDTALMPINKSLWTPSYCVFMNGWALLLFAAFYWLIDGNGSAVVRAQARRWLMPLSIYGMNALFLFALSGLVGRLLNAGRIARGDGTAVSLKTWLYAPLAALPIDPLLSSVIFAIAFDLAMFAVAWWMWKKRWFIKV